MADPAGAAALGAYIKLLRASRAVVGRIEPRLTAHGLTTTQFGVLEAVLHKGPLTQRELGRKVLTSPGNLTDVIDKLHARGLVERQRCKDDRRSVRVELTECGRQLVADLFPGHAADIADAMSGLTAAELRTLGDLLRRLGMAAERPPDPLAKPGAANHLAGNRSMSND